jgi:hypothetical protein
MDLLAVRRERVEPPGHAVVEPGTDVEHDIAAMHREIGFVGAVHAEHAEELRIVGRIGAQAHQSAGDGEAGFANEADQRGRCTISGIDDAAAAVDHRASGGFQQRHGLGDLLGCRGRLWAVAAMRLARLLGIRRLADQDVLRQIDHHRAGAAAAGDIEGFVHHAGEILAALDQIVVLGRRAGDAGGVGFLERVIADEMSGHLPGQAHHGNAVHQRVHQTGDGVGRTRTGGDQHHADTAGAAGVALGGMHRSLFVAHKNVTNGVLLEDRVVDRQYRAAGIPEDHLYALVLERAEENLGTGLLFGGNWGGLDVGLGHGSYR